MKIIPKVLTLYRVVSEAEKIDYDKNEVFQLGINTLEAKQFFKSREAIVEFVIAL